MSGADQRPGEPGAPDVAGPLGLGYVDIADALLADVLFPNPPGDVEVLGAQFDPVCRTVRLIVQGHGLPQRQIGKPIPEVRPVMTRHTAAELTEPKHTVTTVFEEVRYGAQAREAGR